MIKASIIGGTGYAGQELIRILMRHPDVEVVTIGTRSFAGQKFSDVYGNFENITDLVCEATDIKVLAEKSDVVFLALPHGIASKTVTAEVLEKQRSLILVLISGLRILISMRTGTKPNILTIHYLMKRFMDYVNCIVMR